MFVINRKSGGKRNFKLCWNWWKAIESKGKEGCGYGQKNCIRIAYNKQKGMEMFSYEMFSSFLSKFGEKVLKVVDKILNCKIILNI